MTAMTAPKSPDRLGVDPYGRVELIRSHPGFLEAVRSEAVSRDRAPGAAGGRRYPQTVQVAGIFAREAGRCAREFRPTALIVDGRRESDEFLLRHVAAYNRRVGEAARIEPADEEVRAALRARGDGQAGPPGPAAGGAS